MYRVGTGYTNVLVNTLSAEGLDVIELSREAGLNLAVLSQQHAFYERSVIYRLWALAAQASGDANIGLKAYDHVHPGNFQVVGYSMMSSMNLKRALERLVRFSPLISSGLSLFLGQEGQNFRLAGLDHQCDSVKPRQYSDAGLASLLGFCNWLTGGRLPKPLRVEFTYPEPEDISEHQRLFGNELRFGAAYDSILFDGQELLRPLSMANESLAVLHDSFAEAQLDQLYGFTIVCRIRALITERLSQGQGQCDMESIATALNISKRTLQRALEKDGAQFKDVLNDVRRQLADFYLRYSHFNMKHVTHALGFHDHSSFHKACIRWFGMTPGQYRVDGSVQKVGDGKLRLVGQPLAIEGGHKWTPFTDTRRMAGASRLMAMVATM
ncbi:AraC family transcriptional regulator [Pseudomonas sp. MPC6]|uniref:AraC family transcriptional regulator n=1 Tax=unclassified Pseudomonas TaxID=196821 RepID=UPI0011109DE3|nr:AraC family transcriptional regulator [Pseudomonas sp. MPC6]QCY13235.1 AraC family transcriptional regulator [Pseudomonas sp. MPC6]